MMLQSGLQQPHPTTMMKPEKNVHTAEPFSLDIDQLRKKMAKNTKSTKKKQSATSIVQLIKIALASGTFTPNSILHVKCTAFPKGTMDVVMPYLSDELDSFVHKYGSISSQNLSNPDLKILVKQKGRSLKKLRITPAGLDSKYPALQGCGYRAIASSCMCLRELEIPLVFDKKKQLLDRFEHTQDLQVVVLRDIENTLNLEILVNFVKRCPQLERLEIHGKAKWMQRKRIKNAAISDKFVLTVRRIKQEKKKEKEKVDVNVNVNDGDKQ